MKTKRAWTEKYGPDTINDIIGNEGIIKQFQQYSRTAEFPNILLAGPPGTGKSAVVLALARGLHGEQLERHTLRLDGINNQGRNAITHRAARFVRADYRGQPPRILIIEQAEVLTRGAQMALRPLMERHTNRVRIALVCNHSSPIVDGVQSLCAIYRFAPVEAEPIGKRLREIADAEELVLTEDAVAALVEIANGDVRRAINSLQAVAATEDEPIAASTVNHVLSTVRPEGVQEMLTEAMAGDYEEAKSRLDALLAEGVSGTDILVEARGVAHEFDVADESTLNLINQIGETQYRLNSGGEASIQLAAFLADLARHDGS